MFKPIPIPGPHDWLANHEEDGQTFYEFVQSGANVPDLTRNTLHLLPLTFFEKAVPADVLELLAEFASYFFAMPVKLLAMSDAFVDKVNHRTNEYTGQLQVNASQILKNLTKALPPDSFCTGAITLCDLYPRDSWNFVFGLGSIKERAGVYSLARYMPGFPSAVDFSTSSMTRYALQQ